MNQELTTNSFS